MIIEENGKNNSVRTPAEEMASLRSSLGSLTPEEKKFVLEIIKEFELKQEGDGGEEAVPSLYEIMSGFSYDRPVVDIKTWLEDEYYFGEVGKELWPKVRENIIEMFSGDYQEIILGGGIGSAKCLTKDAEIFDMNSGRRLRMDEIDEFKSLVVQGINRNTGESRIKESDIFGFTGVKKVCSIELKSGKKIRSSLDHPFLTKNGWERADSLKVGSLVATPRRIFSPLKCLEISDAEVKFVAYMLAEGGCTSGNWDFTSNNFLILRDFEKCSDNLYDPEQNDKYHKWIRSGISIKEVKGDMLTVRSLGTSYLKRRYLDLNCLAKHKRIPSEFYGLNDRQLALFLNRIFSCDGSVRASDSSPFGVAIGLASEKFIDDIQFLLLRFGIHSRKHYNKVSCKVGGVKKFFDSWRLTIYGAERIIKFFENIGFLIGKEEKCDKIFENAKSTKENTNIDVVPVGYSEMKMLRGVVGPISRKRWDIYRVPAGQLMGHKKFNKFCDEYKVPDEYKWWGASDIFWDEIKSIKTEGFEDVYDLTVPEMESFIANGIYCHNTTTSAVGICRLIYEMSCYREPQKSLGISSGSRITFVNFSVTQKQAREVIQDDIVSKLAKSPYFNEEFPFESTLTEIRFPKGIWIAPASSQDTNILGMHVFGAIMDEGNFMPSISSRKALEMSKMTNTNRAEIIYNSLIRRIKSRFVKEGRVPGKVFLVSSKKGIYDFTERRIRDSANDPHVFVRESAVWEIAPEDHYSKERFYVVVGNQQVKSRILNTKEEADAYKEIEGIKVVPVPVDFKREFELDMESSIRELAGVATFSITPFIPRRDKIAVIFKEDEKRDHPFASLEWDTGTPPQFIWGKLIKKNANDEFEPILNPRVMRHVHLDLSRKYDATGFSMGHVSGYKDVVRGAGVNQVIERKPVVTIDFILRIVPPPGDEIYLPEVRTLIYELSAHGFNIGLVTFDRYGSDECAQQLKVKGYKASVLSVDQGAIPYENLKNSINEERVKCYYYEMLEFELASLVRNSVTGKIDHPEGFSKDTCLVGDTKISLTNGQEIPIRDLVGKEVEVYSCKDDGNVSVGKMFDIRCTGTKETIRVWLDNGKYIDCTTNHPFMMRDGSYKNAGELRAGDSLMPLYRDISVGNNKTKLGGYEIVKNNKTGEWEYTHHIVAGDVFGWNFSGKKETRMVIHHKDFNKKNNSSDNLEWMAWEDHRKLHCEIQSKLQKERWANGVFSNRNWRGKSPKYLEKDRERIIAYNKSKERIEKLKASGLFERNGRILGDITKSRWLNSDYIKKKKKLLAEIQKELASKGIHNFQNLKRNSFGWCGEEPSEEKVNEIKKKLSEGGRKGLARSWSNPEFRKRHSARCSERMKRYWEEKRECANHKVIKIELLGEQKVYDATVTPTPNFALSAGVFVHNSDAFCGVVYSLENKKMFVGREALPPPMMGISENVSDEETRELEGEQIDGALIMPPMLGGPSRVGKVIAPRYIRKRISTELGSFARDGVVPFVGGEFSDEKD